MALEVTVHRIESRHLLHTEASPLREDLLAAAHHGPHALVIDMSAVESIDSECLGVILLVARLLPKPSRVCLFPAKPHIKGLCELLHAQSIVECVDSLSTAMERAQDVLIEAASPGELPDEEPGLAQAR